jgi:hypothetical protein
VSDISNHAARQTSTTCTTGKLAGFSNELFEHNKIELELKIGVRLAAPKLLVSGASPVPDGTGAC